VQECLSDFGFQHAVKNILKHITILMIKNSAVRSISELGSSNYLVEDYQRGYQWKETEVLQLLKDIGGFEEAGFYCLQPIVVKQVDYNDQPHFELIDGQQRLTTIYIILSFLNLAAEGFYGLVYRTRTSSEEFLLAINSLSVYQSWDNYIADDENHLKDNIDNFHFFKAYKTVSIFFKNRPIAFADNFKEMLMNRVKVIWYEIPPTLVGLESKIESIKIFRRINSGKIPLTNSELIKALFLINIEQGKHQKALQLKQNEIAQQWDMIEYALQDDAFWYFISNSKPGATRIDLLFDLLANKPAKTDEKLYTFLHYSICCESEGDKNKWVATEWETLNNLFLTLREWYEDKILFHMIGYLIWKETSLAKILKWKYELYGTRQEFERKVHKASKIKFPAGKTLDKLEYSNTAIVRQVLVLHNILTLLKNETSNNFSFSKFKTGSWDIEHIHAQDSKDIKEKKDWLDWKRETVAEIRLIVLSQHQEKYRIALFLKIDALNDETITKAQFDDMFRAVIEFYQVLDEDKQDTHALSNLALLDAGTNRSYQNAIFSVKRRKIIDRDREGIFVPVCTKNVFLKYFTDNLSQMYLWTGKDREAYYDDIETTLKNADLI
jgi:hypothetical protein